MKIAVFGTTLYAGVITSLLADCAPGLPLAKRTLCQLSYDHYICKELGDRESNPDILCDREEY